MSVTEQMSYTASLDTARTLIKVGRKELARYSLLRALADVPESSKVAANVDYLNILSLLTNLTINNSDWSQALGYLEEGLRIKPDHSDLLFLKILFFYDSKRYDELLPTVGMYFLSLGSESNAYRYEFAGERAHTQLFTAVIPRAYQGCANRPLIKALVTRMAQGSNQPLLRRMVDVMNAVDGPTLEQAPI